MTRPWRPTTKYCGCRYEDPHQEELSHLSYDWTRRQVSCETKAYLGGLPFRISAASRRPPCRTPVVLVHGTPTLNTLYWTEDRPDEFCLKMAGHVHSAPIGRVHPGGLRSCASSARDLR